MAACGQNEGKADGSGCIDAMGEGQVARAGQGRYRYKRHHHAAECGNLIQTWYASPEKIKRRTGNSTGRYAKTGHKKQFMAALIQQAALYIFMRQGADLSINMGRDGQNATLQGQYPVIQLPASWQPRLN